MPEDSYPLTIWVGCGYGSVGLAPQHPKWGVAVEPPPARFLTVGSPLLFGRFSYAKALLATPPLSRQ